MKNIIEGLKVTISGTELAKLCANRSKHHRSRAAFYEKTKNSLPSADDEFEAMTSNSSKRPDEMMKERIARHHAEAAEFDFIGSHLIPKANYLLDRADLHRLGILSSAY